MNASISPEERALIDEAIAAGNVQRFPIGATAEPQWVWCERSNRLVDRRIAKVEPGKRKAASLAMAKQAAKERMAARAKAKKKPQGREPCPIVTARRAEVLRLHEAGMTGKEICTALGISLQTLTNDRTKLGITLRRHPGNRHTAAKEARG